MMALVGGNTFKLFKLVVVKGVHIITYKDVMTY